MAQSSTSHTIYWSHLGVWLINYATETMYLSGSVAYALNCDAESRYDVIPRAKHVEYTYSVSRSEASKLDAVYGPLAAFNVQITRDQASNLK